MARPQTTSADAILRSVTRLTSERGPSGATVQVISAASGATVGSLYHRFESREALLAQAWLGAAEAFLETFFAALDRSQTIEDGLQAALAAPRWARRNREEAALIISYRREEFLSPGAPQAVKDRADALAKQLGRSVKAFAGRAGLTDAGDLERCRYALIGVAEGALRLYLPRRAPPMEADAWIEAAYRAVMAG